MSDFIESGDEDYAKQASTFTDYVKANPVALSVTPAEAIALDNARIAYNTSLQTYDTAVANASALNKVKDGNRASLEAIHRGLNHRFQANATITAAQKESMRLNVADKVRSRATHPASRPSATIEASTHLHQILNFRDEDTLGSKARPAGVIGAEIWGAITAQGAPPPAAPEGYHMLAQDRTPHLCEYDSADTGKTAYYILRWVNSHREHGPWSDAVSATIS